MITRKCIHDRTEKQKCRLCNLVSSCCNYEILRVNLHEGHYVCQKCKKKCSVTKII
jgi:hypothetical protein